MHALAGLLFAVILVFLPEERLHVHDLMIPMGKAQLAISKALRRVGGRHLEKCVVRQLKPKSLYFGPDWRRYYLKVQKKTNVLLACRHSVIMNRPLNAAAKDFHKNNRPRKLQTAKLVVERWTVLMGQGDYMA